MLPSEGLLHGRIGTHADDLFLCLSNSIINMKFCVCVCVSLSLHACVLWIKPETLCMLAKYCVSTLCSQLQIYTFEEYNLLILVYSELPAMITVQFQTIVSSPKTLSQQQAVPLL